MTRRDADRRPTPVILAVDVGTTETKSGLVALDGRLVALERATYRIDSEPAARRAEQDPEDWWTAIVSTSRALAERPAVDVVAICVDGHGPTLAAVDAEGRPTRPAITWLDTRAGAEAAELTAATGLAGWSLGILPAALWLERREPAVSARTAWYLNSWEAIALRLTGIAATTLVAGGRPPSHEDLAAGGLDARRLAPVAAAGSSIGGLTAGAARALGLRPGLPVIGGVVDAFASFHGAALLEPGDAIDVGGGAGGFGVYWDAPIDAAGAFCTPAPLPGRYVVGGAMAATGKALDWFRDGVLDGTTTTAALLDEAAAVPPGAGGVVFLPYLAGERAPLWDPGARGAFVGLRLDHGRGHLVRAILEAAALAIRHVAEPIVGAGVRVTAMRLAGGPARSESWNQLKADVTGFPVEVPGVLETAVVGSAILAAVGIGAYPDLLAAIRGMTRIDRRLEPRPELVATYDALYRTYLELHPAIASALGGARRSAVGARVA